MPLQDQKTRAINLFVEENLGVSLSYTLLHQVLADLRSELGFQNDLKKCGFTLAGDHFEQSGRVRSTGRS